MEADRRGTKGSLVVYMGGVATGNSEATGSLNGMLDLATLKTDYRPGITPTFGGVLAECGAVCLDSVAHQTGVSLLVDGDFAGVFPLVWEQVTDQMKSCYADEEVTTEHGAYGVAILLVDGQAQMTVVERSRKGTGFDFWLGIKPAPYLQGKARLEVSGIRRGDEAALRNRIKIKLRQVEPSDTQRLPAFIVVVEFGTPRSRMVKK
jgi:hypothetical protein